jgi:hypothetical protein
MLLEYSSHGHYALAPPPTPTRKTPRRQPAPGKPEPGNPSSFAAREAAGARRQQQQQALQVPLPIPTHGPSLLQSLLTYNQLSYGQS